MESTTTDNPIRLPQPLRCAVRELILIVAVLLTAPFWGVARLARLLGRGDGVFLTCSQILGAVPGFCGIALRRAFYWMSLARCGRDCSVGCGTWFTHAHVALGRRVYIGGRSMIGMCEIGDDALIGSNVDVLSGRRQHGNAPGRPRSEQGGTLTPLRLGRNVWIGNSAVVMADVGDDAIIGAGSVVVHPIPAGAVAAGNPAVVKKLRAPGPATSSPETTAT